MNSITQKGLKPIIFRVLVIVMSLLYALGPSHKEINKLLHIIAHQLEMPENVITHSSNLFESTTLHHISYNEKREAHNHSFLNFLDKILEGTNSSNSKKNTDVEFRKIDKHVRVFTVFKRQLQIFSLINKQNLAFIVRQAEKGFPIDIIVPPQLA